MPPAHAWQQTCSVQVLDQVADEKSLIIAVGYMLRSSPAVVAAKQIMNEVTLCDILPASTTVVCGSARHQAELLYCSSCVCTKILMAQVSSRQQGMHECNDQVQRSPDIIFHNRA